VLTFDYSAPSDFQELDDLNADGDVESRPASRRVPQKDYTIERKLSENLVKKHLRTMLSETLATFILVFLGATVVSARFTDSQARARARVFSTAY
jgi:hypothetical protein